MRKWHEKLVWKVGMKSWYKKFYFCMKLRFVLQSDKEEGAMNRMRSWYEKLIWEIGMRKKIWIKLRFTLQSKKKEGTMNGMGSWYENLVWEVGMRNWYEKLVWEVGMKSWYEKLVWEIGTRNWYKKLEWEFFFLHEFKVYSTSLDENNQKLEGAMNHAISWRNLNYLGWDSSGL